jgi:hypothetical protein
LLFWSILVPLFSSTSHTNLTWFRRSYKATKGFSFLYIFCVFLSNRLASDSNLQKLLSGLFLLR